MNTALIKPAWSPLTIALMVIGFIIFWPLGLAVLGYIMWGEKFGGSAEKAQSYFNKGKSWVSSNTKKSGFTGSPFTGPTSGNAAFDDYRKSQLERLEEERRRLDDEIAAFHEHSAELRKHRDREEFEAFMADRNATRQGFGDGQNTSPQNPSWKQHDA